MVYDNYFFKIAAPILNHPDFRKLKEIKHHTTTRYDHVLSVALISYSIAKRFNLDKAAVIRGALLHDFFFESSSGQSLWVQFKNFRSHPNRAGSKALEIFNINKKEFDIITKHMFPATFILPLYKETWLVLFIDNLACIYEYVHQK